jgi:hypothetical protein
MHVNALQKPGLGINKSFKANESTADLGFVCLDVNLREAGFKEGFSVLPK